MSVKATAVTLAFLNQLIFKGEAKKIIKVRVSDDLVEFVYETEDK